MKRTFILILSFFSLSGIEAQISFNAPLKFKCNSNPVAVSSGYIDADTLVDLAVANYTAGTISIFMGSGAGNFTLNQEINIGAGPASVLLFDLYGTGKTDLLVTQWSTNSLVYYPGNGNGSFGASVTSAAGNTPVGFVLGNFNGDNLSDLYIVNQADNTVRVLIGAGAGQFNAGPTIPVGSQPWAITGEDFNNDNYTDVAVALKGIDSAALILSNGVGAFQPPVNFKVLSSPQSIITAQINNDGHTDLVIGNFGSDSISVLLGNGSGGFSSAQNFYIGNTAYAVGAADFDGDGQIDVVSANYNYTTSNVSVMNNLGNGTLGFEGNYIAGNLSSSLSINDFNQDGKLDIVTTNSGEDSISVLLSNTTLINSIKHFNSEGDLMKVTPTPFSCQLTFSFADNTQTTVSLYNFLGQQVLQQTFTTSTTINTAQLADGIYFYELRSNKGTLKTGKVVKQ